MTDKELRIQCLYMCDGDASRAMQAYDWIKVGEMAETPQPTFVDANEAAAKAEAELGHG